MKGLARKKRMGLTQQQSFRRSSFRLYFSAALIISGLVTLILSQFISH